MTLYTEQVTGGQAREVYGGLTACDAYVLDMVGDGADAYAALVAASNTDKRKRLLITATRYIDRQRWLGTANADGATTLQWPRDDIEDEDGEAVSNADQLALVEQAVFELVAILASDEDASSNVDSGSNVKSMGAGTARLEFFSPTSVKRGTATKLPTVVDELLGRWLASTSSETAVIIGGISSGTDGEASFDDCDDYERSDPF